MPPRLRVDRRQQKLPFAPPSAPPPPRANALVVDCRPNPNKLVTREKLDRFFRSNTDKMADKHASELADWECDWESDEENGVWEDPPQRPKAPVVQMRASSSAKLCGLQQLGSFKRSSSTGHRVDSGPPSPIDSSDNSDAPPRRTPTSSKVPAAATSAKSRRSSLPVSSSSSSASSPSNSDGDVEWPALRPIGNVAPAATNKRNTATSAAAAAAAESHSAIPATRRSTRYSASPSHSQPVRKEASAQRRTGRKRTTIARSAGGGRRGSDSDYNDNGDEEAQSDSSSGSDEGSEDDEKGGGWGAFDASRGQRYRPEPPHLRRSSLPSQAVKTFVRSGRDTARSDDGGSSDGSLESFIVEEGDQHDDEEKSPGTKIRDAKAEVSEAVWGEEEEEEGRNNTVDVEASKHLLSPPAAATAAAAASSARQRERQRRLRAALDSSDDNGSDADVVVGSDKGAIRKEEISLEQSKTTASPSSSSSSSSSSVVPSAEMQIAPQRPHEMAASSSDSDVPVARVARRRSSNVPADSPPVSPASGAASSDDDVVVVEGPHQSQSKSNKKAASPKKAVPTKRQAAVVQKSNKEMTTTKNTRRRKSQVQSSSEEEDEEDEGSSSASDEEASNDDEEEGSDASSVDEYLSHQQVLRQFELEREGQGRGGLGDHLSSHRRSSNGGGSSRQTSSSGTGRDAFQHLIEVMARASEPQGESFMRNLSRHGRQGKTWGHLVAAQEQTVGRLATLAESQLGTMAWKPYFREHIRMFPRAKCRVLREDVGICDACGRGKHPASYRLTLSGAPYDSFTFMNSERWDLGISDAAKARAARKVDTRRVFYLVGVNCLAKAQLYHAAWHFKCRLMTRVKRRLRTVYESSADDFVDDASSKWHEKQYKRFKSLMRKVESTSLTNQGRVDVGPEWDLWGDAETSSSGESEDNEDSEASTEDERAHRGGSSMSERMHKFTNANAGDESASDFE